MLDCRQDSCSATYSSRVFVITAEDPYGIMIVIVMLIVVQSGTVVSGQNQHLILDKYKCKPLVVYKFQFQRVGSRFRDAVSLRGGGFPAVNPSSLPSVVAAVANPSRVGTVSDLPLGPGCEVRQLARLSFLKKT